MALSKAKILFSFLAWMGLWVLTSCSLFGGGETLQRSSHYRVDAPAQWKNRAKEESDHAYRLPSGAIVTVTSSCGRSPTAPLKALTRHLLFGVREVQIQNQEASTIDSLPALYTDVSGTSEGNPIYLALAVINDSGCVYDFSLLSPKKIEAEDRKAFIDFTQTFKRYE